jgi:butyryl-CoA dehydrogenase
MSNPLIDDRLVQLLLDDVVDVAELCKLGHFAEHSPETFDLYLDMLRRFSRSVLYPAYKPMDEEPPSFVDGHVHVHPTMREIYPKLVELGVTAATRPMPVGGQQLPLSVATLAHAYLMAGNLSAYGYVGLTTGAAHLIETFGDDAVRELFLQRLYEGTWTGTMALTEPQAGSSLADITTRAVPMADGRYHIVGSKIFISGGEHDITDNVVNMTLARIDGAPPGTRGISLFAIPNRREEGGELVDNDVRVAGVIHKIGWRGLPSLALAFGDGNDCIGWLVGAPHRGLRNMFQMMNEARIMVGVNAAATASVAYHESLAYARDRPQGRPLGGKDPSHPQVAIIEHADVRRMLLRQKAIVEGALALLATASRFADLAEHAEAADDRERAQLLLDLLTPIAKSFPAEWGFESNALAVQVHGGYGYSSEYLPEAWLRDQKLNSIHEGTTGIQGLDLLGRRAVAKGGAALVALREDMAEAVGQAAAAGLPAGWGEAILTRLDAAVGLTAELGARGLGGDVEAMLLHSNDYLSLMSILAVAWQHLRLATVARRRLAGDEPAEAGWLSGLVKSAQYWLSTELPRVDHLIELCRDAEDSYAKMSPDWF